MAIPSNLSITTIVTEGLQRGGRTTPSASQIATATSLYMALVKSDLHRAAPCHPSLMTHAAYPTVLGLNRYDWPVDAEEIDSVSLVAGSTQTGWTDTAQAGSSSSITFASGLSAPQGLAGHTVYGTTVNVESRGQILTYNDTSKAATLSTVVGTAFAASSPYMIDAAVYPLRPTLYTEAANWSQGLRQERPGRIALLGRSGIIDRAPDQAYILDWSYWAALDRLDEAGAVFLRHLREWAEVYVQGVAVKTMARYDEDRRNSELTIYNGMLAEYASRATNVLPGHFTDL